MSSQTEDAHYRPVNLEFLAKGGGDPFDIYTRSEGFGTISYVKFASTHPKHQEKVLRLLEEGEAKDGDFYIQEDDLFKYYAHATQSLRAMVSNPKIPHTEKTKKIYDVSKGVMKEFFSYHASGKILESSEEVMGMMEECMSTADTGFGSIAQIANKDYYTHTHSVNVGLYCMTYGLKAGMGREDARQLGLGGMLHDVGKSKIPESIINKNGGLTDKEFEEMKNHAPQGEELLRGMTCYTNNVVRMAGEHHEKFCGGGYPKGLVGEEIALFARICKIMDVYDALTTRRSYKKAMSAFDTLTLMNKQMGDEFDRKLLGNFIRLMGPDL